MLEQMRQQSRSIIIYVFFGIIIAVFVLNFGPQSAGITSTSTSAGYVAGNKLTTNDLNYALAITGAQQISDPAQYTAMKARILDQIILRELLAEDAYSLGLRVPEEELQDNIVKGRLLVFGTATSLRDPEDTFDYDRFSKLVRFRLGVSVKKFKEQQARELLAEKYRNLIAKSLKASDDEVQADFLHENTKVKLAYVRFSPSRFYNEVYLKPDEIAAYATSKEAEIKTRYQTQQKAFTGLPKQVRVSLISSAFANDGEKNAARRKLDDVYRQLQGGAAFADLAMRYSDDETSRGRGGSLSWVKAEIPGFSESVTKALSELKEGTYSTVLEDQHRWVIVKLEGRREGNLDFEQAKLEIAEEMLREERAQAVAKASAEKYVARIKAGEKIETLFPNAAEVAKAQSAGNSPIDLGAMNGGQLDMEALKKKIAEQMAQKEKEQGQGAGATSQPTPPGATPGAPSAPSLLSYGPDALLLNETNAFTRSSHDLVPGIGISKELMSDAFKMQQGQVADTVYMVGKVAYLVFCQERKNPDMKEWEKDKAELRDRFVSKKAMEMVRGYEKKRCDDAVAHHEIDIAPELLAPPPSEDGTPMANLPTFVPCKTLDMSAGGGGGEF